MFKKYRYLFLSAMLVVLYLGIQIVFSMMSNTSEDELPIIKFDSNELVLSVNAQELDYLQGVSAIDSQDGDLSNQVLVEDISIFINETTRQVTYVVFDSDGNVARNSRIVKYEDYTAPVFSMKNQLRNVNYSTSKVTELLQATSCVDGDISHNITIMDVAFVSESKLRLKVSVTDSTNTTSYLNLNYYLDNDYDIEIVLDEYLVYLKLGETFDYRKNIINVIEKLYQDSSLIYAIDIDVPEMTKPGTYEVTYSIHRANGNHGVTTLVVIVE